MVCHFLPVYYNKTLVEWRLREKGGGLVTVHPADSDLLNRCQRDSQGRLVTPGGETQLTTTANHYGYALIDGTPQRCVINMTGSQLKHSRGWNTLIQGTKLQGAKGAYTPPAYSHWYQSQRRKWNPMTVDRGTAIVFRRNGYWKRKEVDLFKEAEEFSKFCSAGGMDQLPGQQDFSNRR